MNTSQVVRDFVETYYSGMSSKGIASLLYLFDKNNVQINFNGQLFTKAYDLLQFFVNKNIQRFVYRDYKYMFNVINSNMIVVQVSGLYQALIFGGQYLQESNFIDTFILTNVDSSNIFNKWNENYSIINLISSY